MRLTIRRRSYGGLALIALVLLGLSSVPRGAVISGLGPALAQARAGQERGGTLVVEVEGLPRGSAPAGVVRGQGRTVRLRAGRTTIPAAEAGAYVVDLTPATVRRSLGAIKRGARLIPSRSAGRAKVRVRAGKRAVARVRYGTILNAEAKSLPASAPVSALGDPESPSGIVLAGSPQLKRGSIVSIPASATLPRGLLARVLSSSPQHGQTMVSVKPVSPFEVVPVGEFTVPLEEMDDAQASLAGALSCGGASGIAPIRKIRDIQFDGAWNTVRVLGQDIHYGLRAEVKFTLEAGLEVTKGIGAQCKLSAEIPVNGMAGPVPVTGSIGGELTAFAGAGARLKATGSVRVGIGVTTAGTLARPVGSVEDPRFNFDATAFAEARAGIGVGAKVGVGNSNVGSLTARFDNDITFTAKPGSCSWDARFGQASIEGKILGWDVETPRTPALFTKNLWHRDCGRSGGGSGGAGAGAGGGGGGGGGGGSGGGSAYATTYHASAVGPYTGPPAETNKPESPLLSVGYDYGCAIGVSQTVRCFGGDLDFYDASPPAGSFRQVSVGGVASCGVRLDSTLACWGWIRPGEPVSELGPPPTGSFSSVSMGLVHACAVDTQYILVCWGKDGEDAAAVPDPGRYTQVSAGWNYTCGIHTDGTLDCWGEGAFGAEATPPKGTFREVSVGESEACGLTYLNDLVCWGNGHGIESHAGPFTDVDMGSGWVCARRASSNALSCFSPFANYVSPWFEFAPRAGTYSDLSLGRPGICGRHDDGSVTCWAGDYAGQVTPAAGPFTKLMAGDFFTCGLRADQSPACWGNVDGETPTQLAGSFLSLSGGGRLGFGVLCGIRTNHTLICGDGSTPLAGSYEELAVNEYEGCAIATGSGTTSCWSTGVNAVPVPPAESLHGISGNGFASWSRYCALRADQTIACWQPPESVIPFSPPPAGQFTKVAVGAFHTDCGIRTDGTLACWWPSSYAGPNSPPAGTFVDVAVGGQTACAIRNDGTIACWGRGDHGEMDHPAGAFVQIVAGDSHMCARRADNSVACWGHGDVLSAA